MKHYIIAGIAALMTPFLVACSDDENDRGINGETTVTTVLSLDLYDNTCCVVSGETEATLILMDEDGNAATAEKDITVTIDTCFDPGMLVMNYNSTYGSDYALMPEGVCSIVGGTISKGGKSLSLKVKIDKSKLDAAFRTQPFLMPLRIKPADASIKGDSIIYVTAPIVRDGDEGSKLVYLTNREPSGEIIYADPANDKAIVFCPGGDFSTLSTEDVDMAKASFKDKGITLAISYYRMPRGHREVPANDSYNLVRVLKANKDKWGGPKVGVMGCSAGGHVAATMATYAPTEFDFQVLVSPVISMFDGHILNVFRNALMGNDPTYANVRNMSVQYHITADVAPTFVAYSFYDNYVVPCWNAQRYINGMIVEGAEVVDNGHQSSDHSYRGWNDYPDAMLNWINNLK